MLPDLTRLLNRIRALAPGCEIVIGEPSDKSTWRIVYQEGALDAQRQAAQAVIDAADASTVFAPMRYIDKLDIIDRLVAAGKLELALSALAAAEPLKQARWNNAIRIADDDPDVTAMLMAIGADPITILA